MTNDCMDIGHQSLQSTDHPRRNVDPTATAHASIDFTAD